MSTKPQGDDDSVEMEITAAPQAAAEQAEQAEQAQQAQPTPTPAPRKVPRRRTPNPVADEVIHSGEIEAPRSMIVRSGEHPRPDSQPKIEIREEPAEPVKPVASPAPAPAPHNKNVMWLLGAAVPAVAAVALLVADRGGSEAATTKPTSNEAARAALQGAAQFIGSTLDGAARATSDRAEAIASSPTLRAGIETDAQTLADQARDRDITFPIKDKEVLEIYQLRDGKTVPMLRLPYGSAEIAAPEVGHTRLDGNGTTLTIVTSAQITGQSPGVGGMLVLAAPVDLEPMRKRVAEHSRSASIAGLAQTVLLVKGPDSGEKVSVPIETESKAKLELAATVDSAAPDSAPVPPRSSALRIVRYACMGLAGMLLIGFVATSMRRTA